ncbi:hypothetical protein GQ54DRAFT_327501 [Martensiomyces pterosporus]|nr:hypothetical protein GQ54DRAFT_327501 [Martensiomyces pterosporus]
MPIDAGKPKRVPEVVVFDGGSSAANKPSTTKFEYKSFMSSKISKINAKPPKPKTQKELKEEEEDKRNDRELKELLEGKVMIERLHESQLTGQERHKYNTQKLAKLGMKVKTKEKMPANMYFAVQRNRDERAKKSIQDAKDRGILNASMKRELELLHTGKTSDDNSKRKPRGDRGLKIGGDRGLKIGSGRFKDGVLHISKSHIARVNGSSSGGEKVGKSKAGVRNMRHFCYAV